LRTLVFGLGNPGAEYKHSRHNIGFDILDAFASAHNLQFSGTRFGLIAEGRQKNKIFALIKPDTFMNRTASYHGF
jgi:PTH1 family peptidyl-tRNA hydrolase